MINSKFSLLVVGNMVLIVILVTNTKLQKLIYNHSHLDYGVCLLWITVNLLQEVT